MKGHFQAVKFFLTDGSTDQPTNRQTDRPTDIATYRAAIAAKKHFYTVRLVTPFFQNYFSIKQPIIFF